MPGAADRPLESERFRFGDCFASGAVGGLNEVLCCGVGDRYGGFRYAESIILSSTEGTLAVVHGSGASADWCCFLSNDLVEEEVVEY